MMYLVSTFAAGAAAIELRNLAVDHANEKILFNGHGFANNDIVLASANIGGTTMANKMYVVSDSTTNDFKLKEFTAGTAAGGAAVTFSSDAGGAATLSKYGTKKCKIATTDATSNKVTCAAATTFAKADELRVYCTDPTGDKCKIDGNVDGAAGGGDIGHGDAVWAMEANATTFQLAKAKPTSAGAFTGNEITINTAAPAASRDINWLLSKDTGSVYAAAPKTLIADGGKWDTAAHGGSATAAVAVCGNAECGVTDGAAYWYTAGSAATTGLTDKNVYYIDGGKGHATPYTFKLNNATKGDALSENTGSAAAVTASGKGDTYQRIDRGDILAGSTAADNKVAWKAAVHGNYAENDGVIFWCSDTTTAADCTYNVTGMTNGSSFKIKGTPGSSKTNLKAATAADGCTTGGTGTAGCADVAVTADSSAKTKGYLLKKNAETATVFPAAAAGSAARSFAMLGSAVAMATAFLLA